MPWQCHMDLGQKVNSKLILDCSQLAYREGALMESRSENEFHERCQLILCKVLLIGLSLPAAPTT